MGSTRSTRPEHLPKVRGLMNRLSRRMDAELDWPAHPDRTIERWENPHIPSGYTYLLQFVAHDLVHSAIPLSVAGDTLVADTANARRTALKLETLFGNGPVGSPFVYAQDAPNDERRTKLRLGRMRWKDKASSPAVRSATSREPRPRTSRGSIAASPGIALRSPKRWSPIRATTITPSCRS